jgi:hypothetical protein
LAAVVGVAPLVVVSAVVAAVSVLFGAGESLEANATPPPKPTNATTVAPVTMIVFVALNIVRELLSQVDVPNAGPDTSQRCGVQLSAS